MSTEAGKPATRVGPITSGERILYIDILRGMALFGILAANMRGFSAPPSLYGNIRPLFHSMPDQWAQGFIDIFIQGKFITLFSFLFGLGFAVQLSRAEARGAKFMSFYPRRLVALAVFGLIHGILIWWGDILLTYALAGALLLLFRKRGNKTLLWWSAGIFSLPILVMSCLTILGLFNKGPFKPQPYHPFSLSRVSETLWIYAHGTVPEIYKTNWLLWKQDSLPSQVFAIYALCLFLAGLWVYRSGIVERLDEYKPLLMKIFKITLPVGIAANAIVVWCQLQTPTGRPTLAGFIGNAFDFPSAHILSLAYASGLAVLIQNPVWLRRLKPFAAVGRMALTDYLTQSILCTLFYYAYTTGTYGHVGPAMGLIPTVVLYGAQVVFSNWWLKRFRFGPVEWIWRGLTYGKLPDLRHEPAIQPVMPIAGEAATAAE